MRPQELNLGDIVQVGECGRFKDYIAKVIAISSDSNHIGLLGTRAFEEYEEDVLGVPISPEMLKMFGFKVEYDGVNVIRLGWSSEDHSEPQDIKVRMFKDGADARFEITYYSYEKIARVNSNFKYLHELQHACRLCGIEINWKL